MSNKRRRIQGLLPINTIQSHGGTKDDRHSHENNGDTYPSVDLNGSGSPRRYREFRKDPRVVEELNHSSTRDFLPLGDDSETFERAAENKEGKEDQNQEEDQAQHQDFETLEETTPLRRSIKRANGLLFASPAEDEIKHGFNGVAATALKVTTSGVLRTVDIRKQMDEKNQCLMIFHNDSQGPRVNFTHRNFEIKNSQLELLRDCEMVIFDKDSTCMAMVLKDLRFIDMDIKSKVGRIQTKLLLWMSDMEGKDSRINKVKNTVTANQSIQTKTMEGRALVVKKLNEIAIQDCKRSVFTISSDDAVERLKSKRNFLDKKNFSSLGPQKRLSQYASSASHKIHVPRTPVVHDLDEPPLPKVSAKDFYHSNTEHTNTTDNTTDLSSPGEKVEKVETEQKKDPSEGVRRSDRTKSRSPALKQSTLWDLDSEKDFETPEIFKPKLRHKFEDGSKYTITNQDFRCLYNHDWINDSILDFFTKYYVENSIERGIVKRDEVHIMSSFFYTKLVSDPSNYYGNVKKWVNNCDLFKKKYVVVPINNSYHWFGCIITNLNVLYNHFKGLDTVSHFLQANDGKNPNAGSGKVEDDEISVSTPIVTILTFDSLRQTHTREIDPIKEFLMAYAKDKYSMDIDKTLIKMKTCMVPQQPNMSDCGVHVILNTKKFFEDPKATMDMWRMTKIRNKQSTRVVNEYFDRASRSGARKDLRNVLWDLQKKQIELMKERNEYIPEEDSGLKNEDEDDGDIEIIENFPQNEKESTDQGPSKDLVEVAPDQRLSPKSAVKKSLENSPTPANDVQEKDLAKSKDDKISIDRDRMVYHSKHSSPQRHVLESSPIGERPDENNRKNSDGLSSPYFGDSPLKRRAPSFGYKPRETILSPKHSSFVDVHESDQEERRRASSTSLKSSASPVILTNEMPYGKKLPVTTNHFYGERSSPSSSSEKALISDLDQDSDVNLVGGTKSELVGKDDKLSHLQQEFERELNDNISQTKDVGMFLNRPNKRQLRPVLVNSSRNILENDIHNVNRVGDEPSNAVIISQNDVQAISSEEKK
ncbi:hypothetical protein ZYGR_0N06790 [Zygosaccharomyces rouxii]|uniref:ZYRO0D15862p n=2 Tax=Zygosaccharomyces rouxii TaxID=4956 RepID=C5DWL8_ZYGRC|nr:uncharacterized protein ZYRO0D15862g [Zygosaccharomyces rouxii]KAH9201098.1 hypothetical protein LQ764DRAFT_103320 [Zygosaccharomyces rouxii]GAV49272.1 hypothetical protein ZYGR_0N06790 [Zygosaccharomyces rouxii]CAR28187.1 ZYRO0D15862p [Zygosaccharomyces rouxii]